MRPSFAKVDKKCRDNLIPLYGSIAVTAKCNLNCVHCYVAEQDEPELTTQEIKSVLSQLANLGCLFLTITGGELFTRKDIFEILEYAKENKFCVTLLTNGTLIEKDDIKFLKYLQIKAIGISLYGNDAESHDRITRKKGSFIKIMRTIEELCKEKFNFYVKYILMDCNWQGFRGIATTFQKKGIRLMCSGNITPKEDGKKDPLRMRLKRGNLHRFYMANLDFAKRSEFKDLIAYSKHRSLSSKGYICKAGRAAVFINAYGEVKPCVVFPSLNLGNIRKDTLKNIWLRKNPDFDWIRGLKANDIPGCRDCKNFKYCIYCPGQSLLRYGTLRPILQQCAFVREELESLKQCMR